MHGDPGYPRFFAVVGLFVFSMTRLVLANNFILLLRLLGRRRPVQLPADRLLVREAVGGGGGQEGVPGQRVGDVGLLLGIFWLWTIVRPRPRATTTSSTATTLATRSPTRHVLAIACLLLFCGGDRQVGAVPAATSGCPTRWKARRRQRPDPRGDDGDGRRLPGRPLHAAVRRWPRRRSSIVACIGGFTALLAALIALTQTDLKRVLAYSTVSQLGYMFLALGSGVGDDLAGVRGRPRRCSTCSRTPSSRPCCSSPPAASCTRWAT